MKRELKKEGMGKMKRRNFKQDEIIKVAKKDNGECSKCGKENVI